MLIMTFFTENGAPKTGLTPSLSIVDSDGNVAVNAQSMTEISLGFYKYDFTTYDEDKDYGIVSDGGSSLPSHERYKVQSNETAGVGNILKIEKNRWKIIDNVLTFYDDNGTTVLYSYNLKDVSGKATMRDVFERETI